jgi:hypothetical protein
MKSKMTPEELKELRQINGDWVGGKKVKGLRFRYNTIVKATMPDGSTEIGCIVGAEKGETEPVYTLETENDNAGIECPESKIEAIDEGPNEACRRGGS